MADRSSSSSLQLCFFAPIRRDVGSMEVCAQPPTVPKVVLVPSPLATTQHKSAAEAWYDIEQDCADCDCACFTDGE